MVNEAALSSCYREFIYNVINSTVKDHKRARQLWLKGNKKHAKILYRQNTYWLNNRTNLAQFGATFMRMDIDIFCERVLSKIKKIEKLNKRQLKALSSIDDLQELFLK